MIQNIMYSLQIETLFYLCVRIQENHTHTHHTYQEAGAQEPSAATWDSWGVANSVLTTMGSITMLEGGWFVRLIM